MNGQIQSDKSSIAVTCPLRKYKFKSKLYSAWIYFIFTFRLKAVYTYLWALSCEEIYDHNNPSILYTGTQQNTESCPRLKIITMLF